jgi:hypothetical protein
MEPSTEIIVEDKTYNLFYSILFFISFLILIILLFFAVAYFFPDSIFKKILLKIIGPPTQSEKIDAVKKKITSKQTSTSSNSLPVSMPTNTSNTTNTMSKQNITTSSNTTVPLDEAVNKYKTEQNYINIHMMEPPEDINAVTHKKGWCLVGNEKGYNSCVKVGYNDYCMSGDIYPTKDICLNPSLRL